MLTDSDGAGFVIRNFLKGAIDKECLKQAYIPDIAGKERRKRRAGKEGKLGVEGMDASVLLEALRRAGATIDGAETPRGQAITKQDLYELGLSGGKDSAARRTQLMRHLSLPRRMSANALLDALNVLKNVDGIARVFFTEKDVVRHRLVQEIVKAYDRAARQRRNS